MEKPVLLVVDDEPNIRRILQVGFDKVGYHTLVAPDVSSAIQTLGQEHVDVVLTDVTMPVRTGYELLREVKSGWPNIPVVIMTAFGTIPQAVQAIRDGAYEFVTKPFDLDNLKRIVASALDQPAKPNASGSRPKSSPAIFDFIAASPAMREVVETVRQVADSRATVMVWGETGVGKEVIAKALHAASSRNKKPLVAISCAAIPETLLESELFGYEKGAFTGANGSKAGKFESANQGTLFLDEVGEIPMSVQVKLLRVLQERECERLGGLKPTKVDVRLVTATNRDLKAAVDQGLFRLDLLYRLQVVELHIPPLRNRLEDIQPLAELFLKKFALENDRTPLVLADAALQALLSYRWPGNVRELENCLERATVLAARSQNELDLRLLPSALIRAA